MPRTSYIIAAVILLTALLLLLKPGGGETQVVTATVTVTKTETKTVTETVARTVFKEPVRVVVLDSRDAELFSDLYAEVAVANVTGPYSFLQAVYGAYILGAKVDVIVAYWGSHVASLARNKIIKPLPDMPHAVRYNGTAYGVPISVEAPILICNKTTVEKPPKSIEELLAFVESGGRLALYVDPVVNSPFVYSVGGAYFNGTPRALLDNRTLKGLDILAELFRRSVGDPTDPEGQLRLFTSGGADCIVDGPWALQRLNASQVSISIFYNKTLAYVKAAYALTDAGAKFITALTNGTQFWKYGYISPYESGGNETVQLLRRAALLAEPMPVYRTTISDPLISGVNYILTQVARGSDPREVARQVAEALLS